MQEPLVSTRRIDRVARACALIGLAGALSLMVDKLFLSGLDYSQGITALRLEQDNQVLFRGGTEHYRSPFLYLGYLTFAFGVVAYVIYLLRPEALSRSSVWLAHLTMASPVVFALLYGGGSPIWLALAVAVGAVVVRVLSNQKPLPKQPLGRFFLVFSSLLFFLYVIYIFFQRRQYQGIVDYTQVIYVLEDYMARPSALVVELIEKGYVSADLMLGLLYIHLYGTHGLSVLERLLRYDGAVGPYYGLYNFYLVTVLLDQVGPNMSLTRTIISEGQAAGVYGWFSTAVGGMYLDFGWIGSLVAAFACGWLSGRVYRRALRGQVLSAKMTMCYVVAGILISPVQTPFTVSISLPILLSILIGGRFVRQSRSSLMPSWAAARDRDVRRQKEERWFRGGAVRREATLEGEAGDT